MKIFDITSALFFLIISNIQCKKNLIKRNKINSYNNKRKVDIIANNVSFTSLKICIDLLNFNYTFPNDTLGKYSKNIFIESMNKAKIILENLLLIEIDYNKRIIFDSNFFSYYGIEYYNKDINNSFLYPYNLYIIFKFNSLKTNIASSKIIYETSTSPIIGLIAIDADKLKFNQLKLTYLTNLFLHQFIHILGFNFQKNSSKKGIINYNKRNKEYNYSKKIVISNFTMSFFEDISNLKLNKNNIIENCDKYIIDDNSNNLKCKQCITDYALNHTDKIRCSKKSFLENGIKKNEYFTNDSGINYYSCSSYNQINHCLKCSNGSTCLRCEKNYILYNNKKCIVYSQNLKNKYLALNRALNNNECSKINFCIKCTSSNKCTLCKDGYSLKNNICKKNKSDNSSENTAIGIFFGSIGLILIIITIVLCIRKKRNERKEEEIIEIEKKEKSEMTNIKNEDNKNVIKDINDNVLVIVNKNKKSSRSIKNYKA